jgi:DNA mismatch repair protein MutL
VSDNNHKCVRILPDFVANQIAAGEVVQRPESVIKEVVENSFDAGADTISVVVRDAGKQLIHIVDNGIGMTKDDLALACKRHATSKLYTPEDLESIATYGFRGEALASISSVADIEIRTLRKGEEHGWRLISQPMSEQFIEPFIADVGTQVFVKNLFHNVPVRKKFLKTNLTEFRYISDTMLKFALSKPHIRFVFYDEGNLIFDAKPTDLFGRIKQVIGDNTAAAIIPATYMTSEIKVSGYVGLPSIAKQTKANQYLFLNGRSIQSKSLNFAVFSAYEHLLEKTKHPFYVLNIELDPHKFDVNVHPQKHEVKFEDEKEVFNAVNRAIVTALAENHAIPNVALAEHQSISPFERISASSTEEDHEETYLVNKNTGEIVEPGTNSIYKDRIPDYAHNQMFSRSKFLERYSRPKEHFDPAMFKMPTFDPPSEFGETVHSAYEMVEKSMALTERAKEIEVLKRTLADEGNFSFYQLHSKYLFVRVDDGVLVIDQHAAHERILYEKTLNAMNREFANSQSLLFPETVELTIIEIATLKEISKELKELGYDFTIKGNMVTIFAAPLDDAYRSEGLSFKSLVEQYLEEQKLTHTDSRDLFAATVACKAAIKTGQKMSKEETIALLKRLLQCEMPYCCPHGRPTIIEISLYNLDKLFGRIL